MEVNYDQLLLGKEIQLGEKAKLYIPTINDLVKQGQNDLLAFSRAFVVSVREQFSSVPEKVDEIEDKYPTFWEIAHDADMSKSVGEAMFGDGIDILSMLVAGLAYWTRTEMSDFQIMSNGKIVNEKIDLVVDKEMFLLFQSLLTMITNYEVDEDMIAPRGISKKKNQCRIFRGIYKGRLRQRRNRETKTLADKILILETLSGSFIPFDQIGEMTYYQFTNLLNAYLSKRANDQDFTIYTSYKFDTQDMKITDLTNAIGVVKVK